MPNHFEAKKHAYRQTQDGIVVSFVLHPSDVSEAIAMAPLGTRFMVAFAEIGDDEKPVELAASSNGKTPDFDSGNSRSNRDAASKGKRKFSELSLAEQCGIRCEDEQFCKFIESKSRSIMSRDSVVAYVREFCGVDSRAKIIKHTQAAVKWVTLNSQFEAWQLDQKYADVRR